MEKPCFIDIHCHIDVYKNIETIVERAKSKGVEIIVNNGMTVLINRQTLDLSKKYPEIKAAIGIYPNENLEMSKKDILNEIDFIRKNKKNFVAIGEVGIDLKETDEFERQKEIFEKFIELSKELDKPLIVHSRKAEEKVIEILEQNKAKKVVMHCFSGKLELVKRIIKNGWSLSIPANITHSEHFQKVVDLSPIENLFCETDSPFLHPIKNPELKKGEEYLIPELGFWNKNISGNEPVNVIFSYDAIAKIKGISIDECKKTIFENYKRMFFCSPYIS